MNFGHKDQTLNGDIRESADVVTAMLKTLRPRIALVLGTGLAGLADQVQGAVEIPYARLPGFPHPGVAGHAGKMIAGTIHGVPVLCLKGRGHLYEGIGANPIKVMIRTLRSVGIDTLFLTNAAGSLRLEAPAGEVMAISDHLNLTGLNPLLGPNDDDWGPRFVAMDNAWDRDLRATLIASARVLGLNLMEGVYGGFLGPTFETHAEIRMAKILGADMVGMSTVAECIVARHCGIKVVGCSVITNLGAGIGEETLSHDDNLKWGAVGGEKLAKIIPQFLSDWSAQA